MRSTGRPKQKSRHDEQTLVQRGALDNHVRLQQHQEEYLKWLEETEKQPEVDRYAYKKIR